MTPEQERAHYRSQFSRQFWFAGRLGRSDLFSVGVTTDAERIEIIREEILRQKLEGLRMATAQGATTTYAELFQKAFGQPLIREP